MGPRKKGDDGDDGSTKHKKPNNFWAPFNTWWREHHERTGKRATVLEMREWYAQNAHMVWLPETMPTVEDMLKIAKGLRTIKQVQAYFRSYRKNLKTRKEGEPGSPESCSRRGARRHIAHTRAVGAAAAGSFLAAVQQAAAQHHHQQMVVAAAAVAAAAAAAVASPSTYKDSMVAEGPNGVQDQLPFLEWGFASEAAAAAAMEAVGEGNSEGDGQLSDGEAEVCRTQGQSSPRGHTFVCMEIDTDREELKSYSGLDSLGREPEQRVNGVPGATEEAPATMSMAAANPYFDATWQFHQQHGQPHALMLQQAIAHRRYVKAVRTSLGGGATPRPIDVNGASSGAPALAPALPIPVTTTMGTSNFVSNGNAGGLGVSAMHAVTCRRTRIQTSMGSTWKHEVLEEGEVGPGSGAPILCGMPLQPPCLGSKPQDNPFPGPSAPAGSYPPSVDGRTAMVWHGRSTPGGGSGESGPGGGVMAAAVMDSGVAPPRKQLRCGDRGVVSLGGSDMYVSPPPHGGAGQDSGALQSGMTPPRRLPHSHGGHTSAYPPYYAPRVKAPVSLGGCSGPGVMALSDGGAMYTSQMPPTFQHPHAPPAFRGMGSSYLGVGGTWPPHPHVASVPSHHHQLYPAYHMYGYRHAALGYPPAPPSYGYLHTNHHPIPPYNVAPPYHPYSVHMSSSYGQYYDHPPLSEVGAGSGAAVGSRQTDRSPPGLQPQNPVSGNSVMETVEQQHTLRSEQQHQHQATRAVLAPNAKGPVADIMTGPGPTELPRSCLPPHQQLQPLQLAELPPSFTGGLVGAGGMDSLSNSDMGALSGLSALGLAENDVDGEEAASVHQHPHDTPYMQPACSRALQHAKQHQQKKELSNAAEKLCQQNLAQTAAAQPPSSSSQHSSPGPKNALATRPLSQAVDPASMEITHSSPPPSKLHLLQQPRKQPHQQCPDSCSKPFVMASLTGAASDSMEEPMPHPQAGSSGAVTATAPAATAACSPASTIGATADDHPHVDVNHPHDDSRFAATSDGGATDGTASVYYKTPKTSTGKLLTPLSVPDSLLKSSLAKQHYQQVQEQMQFESLASGGRVPLSAAADVGASAHAAYDAYQTKTRGAPRPLTVHVLQEELVGMPHSAPLTFLGGCGGGTGGSCSLGDLASLHSPTGSLNLTLLEQVADDGGEVGMWGPL